MSNKGVYIHIGMPRTATTFFQQELFPKLSGIEFYGLPVTHYSEAFNKLQFADDTLYDPSLILKDAETWKSDKVLLSNENFIGQSTHLNHLNRTSIAKRLKQAFPDAKIVLVLRNQVDLLASMYAINVQWKETRKIDSFIWQPFQKKEKQHIGGPSTSFYNTLEGYENLHGYDYFPLIELYKELFNEVEILLFEDFIHQPEQFASRLANFIDIDKKVVTNTILNQAKINSGVNQKQANKLARLNKFNAIAENSNLGNRIYNMLKRYIINSNTTSKKAYFSTTKEKELKAFFSERNKKIDTKYPEIGLQNYSAKYYI